MSDSGGVPRLVRMLALLGALAPGDAAGQIDIADGRGVRLQLSRRPARIVSLTPANTEIVFALGAGKRLAGVTEYCDYPEAAKRLPKIGDVTISAEKVAAARPDLVLASASASRKAIQEIERLNIAPVFAVDPNTFEETWSAILQIGRAIGADKEAKRLVTGLRERLNAVRKRRSGKPGPKVLIVVQTDPLWTAGAGTFLDDLVREAGGTNLGAQLGKGYFSMAGERAIAAQPEVILTGAESVDKVARLPGWSRTPAVRERRIHALGVETSRPGPRLIDALEKLKPLLDQARG